MRRFVFDISIIYILTEFLYIVGEKLYLVTVLDILPFLDVNCSIHNYYGPAECTLANLHYEVTCHEPQNSIGLPIGRPMANARVYILDEFLQKVPPGQMGEIVIGGESYTLEKHLESVK